MGICLNIFNTKIDTNHRNFDGNKHYMTENLELKIPEYFIDHINSTGKKPISIAAFSKTLDISEEEFYKYYSSFTAIENYIFKGLVERTAENLNADETYQNYSIREKLLAFHFTLLEELKKQRSFISFYFDNKRWFATSRIAGLKNPIVEYLNELVNAGIDSGEIAKRFSLHKLYADGGYMQTISVIHFWCNDHSDRMEKTDGFIERSVNFTMDLISRNGIDSGFELGKFLFQQFKK